MKEYRVTRPNLYGPNTPGHTDPSARQGYYVNAETEAEACEYVRKRLGLDASESLNAEEGVWVG